MLDELERYNMAGEMLAKLEAQVEAQATRIAELERQLRDKPDYRTLIRFPTRESE